MTERGAELYEQLTKLLGKNSHLLDEYSQELKKRPKASTAWERKRKSECFEVKSNNYSPFIIQGWEDLLKFTGKKEATLRVYFSEGEGRCSLKLHDPATGFAELYHLRRLEGSEYTAAEPLPRSELVEQMAQTEHVLRDADTGEIIDRKGKY